MPGYERAELTAELKILPSNENGREQADAARTAAGETGLAREAGPDTLVLAGDRDEVLDAARKVVEAALDAGAHRVDVKVEAEGDAPRF